MGGSLLSGGDHPSLSAKWNDRNGEGSARCLGCCCEDALFQPAILGGEGIVKAQSQTTDQSHPSSSPPRSL